MSAVCPHCGGAIDLVPTLDGRRKSGVEPAQPPGVEPAQNGSNPGGYAGSAQEVSRSKDSPKGAYDQDFLTFWGIYPLRRDKGKAQNAWRKSVARVAATTGVNPAQAKLVIAAGAARYRDDPNRDPSYTKYAEGWLNGDGWEDEPLPPRGQGRLTLTRPDPPRPMTSGEMDRAIAHALGKDA